MKFAATAVIASLTLFALLPVPSARADDYPEDFRWGPQYNYQFAERYKSIFGGQVDLLEPAGFDHLGVGWLAPAIYIDGTISPETVVAVKNLLERNKDVQWIYLHSPGGDLHAGIALGKLIHSHGLSTFSAYGDCESACALVFLSGKHRISGSPEDKFGFHRQYYIVNNTIRYGSWAHDVATIDKYLRSVNATFISADEIVGTTGLLTYSSEQLRSRGIATGSIEEFNQQSFENVYVPTGYELYYSMCEDNYGASGVAEHQTCDNWRFLRDHEPFREPEVNNWFRAKWKRGEFIPSLAELAQLYAGTQNEDDIRRADCRFFSEYSVRGYAVKAYLAGHLGEIERTVGVVPSDYKESAAAFEQFCSGSADQ